MARTAADIRVRRGAPRVLELFLALAAIAAVAAVLLHTILEYAERAEKAAMEQVVVAIGAGLHLRVALLLVRAEEAAIPKLAEQNPMDLLERRPARYVGAFDATPTPDAAPAGSWYFDTRAKELGYRPVHTRHFDWPGKGEPEVRFKVWLDRDKLPGGERLAEQLRGVRQAEFAAVTPYRWFTAQ